MKQEAARIAPWIDTDLGIAHTTPGIGIFWLWQLPASHPFFRAACYHDSMYDLMRSGKAPYATSKPVDREFLRLCLEAAGDDLWLQEEAKTFYLMCRVWGRRNWKPDGYPEVIAQIEAARAQAVTKRTDEEREKAQRDPATADTVRTVD